MKTNSARDWSRVFRKIVLSATLLPAMAGAADKPFNPDLSVNFLGLTQHGSSLSDNRLSASHNGTILQEAEIQAFSDVDPYFKASALLSIAPSESAAGEYRISPEEIFLETTFIPSVTLKAGQFKAAFGKHNTLHTHAFPFIDAPMINQELWGDGLGEAGFSAAAMLPIPWYSEITVQAMSNTHAFFNSSHSGDYLQVAQLKNLWDLSDETTLEWSVYGAHGPNQFHSKSNAYGTDLIVKWRPTEGGNYHALWWVAQFQSGENGGATEQEGDAPVYSNLSGLSTWLQYQMAERWWLQARYETLHFPTESLFGTRNKQSLLLSFLPSEFSGFRLQVDRLTETTRQTSYALAFQYNVTIGAHPAHSY